MSKADRRTVIAGALMRKFIVAGTLTLLWSTASLHSTFGAPAVDYLSMLSIVLITDIAAVIWGYSSRHGRAVYENESQLVPRAK